MGKFTYAMITVFLIEVALYLFGGTTYANTSLFSFLFNPTTTSAVYTLIWGLIATFGLAGIVASSFFSLNIYGLYSKIASVLMGFGVALFQFWQFINGELTSIFGVANASFADILSVMIVSPLVLYYILAVTEWVRAN